MTQDKFRSPEEVCELIYLTYCCGTIFFLHVISDIIYVVRNDKWHHMIVTSILLYIPKKVEQSILNKFGFIYFTDVSVFFLL